MKRVLPLLLGVLLIAAPGFAQAKKSEGKKSEAKSAKAPKAESVTGKVTAVTADSLAVKGKAADWTFTVDKATTVVAKGGSHKMAELNADKKPTVITEFVSVGDDVTVKYHDMGATKHAATVTVKAPSAAPAKKGKKK
ncbi:MAG TPA: hypothetical protein VF921_16385 [Vicinamibacterales bacterium]